MANKSQETLRFNIRSRLLQELGERLVSAPDIAISELIKNAYDADSAICEINYIEGESLVIKDSGHGMTLDDLKNRWMTIATDQKVNEVFSPKYKRILTGAKGVGRFAVRSLGNHLVLTTVAFDEKKKCKSKIVAYFDWGELDKTGDLLDLEVPYEIEYPVSDHTGTTLLITRLSSSLSPGVFDGVRSNVLKIASPISALLPPDPNIIDASSVRENDLTNDPGFQIIINDQMEKNEGPAEVVLDNYVGRSVLLWKEGRLTLEVSFKGYGSEKKTFKVGPILRSPVYADIRYFPRRKGVFSGIGVDGRRAWKWVRDNHGVGIYDKGFRVSPYGMEQDDWLMLDRDLAHKKREWRTELANEHIPIPEADRSNPARNPVVNMITNYQIVGAVFVKSGGEGASNSENVLAPSMDRQGFVDNSAFKALTEVVRFAVEYMAFIDKKIQLEEEEKERIRKRNDLRKELKSAISEIESSPTLAVEDKKRIVSQYEHFYHNLKDLEEYDRKAREGMDMMGFLGVLAGFMTHEHQSALWEMEKITSLLEHFGKEDSRFSEAAEKIKENIKRISEHVEYTKLFIRGINAPVKSGTLVKPRIRHALKPLRRYAEEHGYHIEIEVTENTSMPPIPIAMYEGVVLNLFSNALKALIANPGADKPTIRICAWEDSSNHYLTVCDTGIGIPPDIRNRIWDPLFTTTSSDNNPLGSGMGLGLPLIKRVLDSIHGKVVVTDAPSGFTTCFKTIFPRVTRYGKS